MFATVIYGYNYCSYAIWILGSIGVAYSLWRVFPKIPKIVASLLGFSLALVAAYRMGRLQLDLFVAHELDFYVYFSDWIFESLDYCYTVPKTVLFDLLPLYYAYRFLSTSGRDSIRFANIPAAVSIFLVFEGISSEFTRWAYPKSIFVLPFVHGLVAGLFVLRGRFTSQSDRLRESTATASSVPTAN